MPHAKATSDLKTLPSPASAALIEQGEAEFEIGARGEVGDGEGGVEIGRERRGAEAVESFAARQAGGGVELGHRHVEGDGEHRRGLDHNAHVSAVPLPLFAGTVDVPTAAHQHVGEQNQVAGKMHEQPLAAGFHGLDGAAGERGVVIDAREFGEDGFEAR